MKDIADDLALIVRNAISYIKDLEQEVDKLKRKAEPVECPHGVTDGNCKECYEAKAEPVQEPVAWMVYTPDGKSVCVTDNPADFTAEHRALPLYTAPPQQALTIERLRDALVASRIIPPAAVEDPDEYDDGVTLFRIEALHRRIT